MTALYLGGLFLLCCIAAFMYLHIFADIICPGPERERREERRRRYEERHEEEA